MKILNFLIEAALYALASIYFYTGEFIGLLPRAWQFLVTRKTKLDIHTFVGAVFLVLFVMALMGKIAYFLPFYDGMILAEQEMNSRGSGAVVVWGFVSIFLLLFARGLWVFVGYFGLGITVVVMLSFADPKPVKAAGVSGLCPVVLHSRRLNRDSAPLFYPHYCKITPNYPIGSPCV